MTIRVKLFAAAREAAGKPEVALELADGATIAQVRESLLAAVPRLQPIVGHARWAVDSEFASEKHAITPSSEIALIPPVSGG